MLSMNVINIPAYIGPQSTVQDFNRDFFFLNHCTGKDTKKACKNRTNIGNPVDIAIVGKLS